jgi:hypothetical protein
LQLESLVKTGISFAGWSDGSEEFGKCGHGRHALVMTRTLVIALMAVSFTRAADFSWDTTAGDGATITHCGGTWNLTNACWNNGSGNVAWSNTTPRKRLMVGHAYNVWRASQNLPDATSGPIPDADNDGENDLSGFAAGIGLQP